MYITYIYIYHTWLPGCPTLLEMQNNLTEKTPTYKIVCVLCTYTEMCDSCNQTAFEGVETRTTEQN